MAEQSQSREERRKQLKANNAKGSKKQKKKSGGIFKKIFLTLIALGIVGMLAGVATVAYMVKDAPKLDPKLLKDPIASKVLDMNGKLIAEVGAENREYVAYKDIPSVVENAFLATEDYRFYQHHGIDPIRLGGAVLANFKNGFGSEGGSTITQQVVKNTFLTREKTLKRKVQEAWLAYQLEQKYTKHQILEMYLNKILMGGNTYGVATAAKVYFGKPLKDVTLPEAALLAGLPQSPNNYNPFVHPDLAEKRRNVVLSLMYQHGYISKAQMEQAQKVPVQSTLAKEDQRKLNEKPYDSFVDAVIDEVKKAGDFDIFSDGLTVYTTLDPNAQLYVDKILNTNEVVKYPDDKFQAGITLLDTKTGEVRAIGGGRNQKVRRGFNYAIDSMRQPGSTIKPILDYGPAIEYLQWGTYHMIVDKPSKYSNGTSYGNWDGRYLGPMTIRTALQMSRNTPAVQTLQQVGTDKAKTFANKLGIPLKEVFESYAIGGLGDGLSTMEMAGAYSAFGNNGFYTPPHTVTKIKLRDGTEINTTPETKVVMKDYTAFMITDMLKSVLEPPGTGTAAKVPGLPIAGKSGTTNYTEADMKKYNITNKKAVPDAWFTGYTTNYTASVWTGYSSRSTPIEPGSDQKIAQLIFKNLMAYVSKDKNTPDFTMPKSVQKVRIEKGTMQLASDYTPDSEVLTEYAVKGYAPKEVSTKFAKPDAPGNAAANFDQAKNEITLSWDYGKSAQFDVSVSINNGAEQKLTTTSDKSLKIANPTPGAKYLFKIIAVNGQQASDPATAAVDIPAPPSGNQGNANGGQGGQGNPNATTPPPANPNTGNPNAGNPNNGNGNGGDGNGTGGGNGGSGTGTTSGTGSTGPTSGTGTPANGTPTNPTGTPSPKTGQ
ncbi:PBP1A family penicillin-binding protein [Neobacillus sp. SM06]|uniref:PBP1A family penicillin-binding protein n=1 Tax=Neobacillus sp. SM06 TaxID=3422492 RepID=UPI003D2BB501